MPQTIAITKFYVNESSDTPSGQPMSMPQSKVVDDALGKTPTVKLTATGAEAARSLRSELLLRAAVSDKENEWPEDAIMQQKTLASGGAASNAAADAASGTGSNGAPGNNGGLITLTDDVFRRIANQPELFDLQKIREKIDAKKYTQHDEIRRVLASMARVDYPPPQYVIYANDKIEELQFFLEM